MEVILQSTKVILKNSEIHMHYAFLILQNISFSTGCVCHFTEWQEVILQDAKCFSAEHIILQDAYHILQGTEVILWEAYVIPQNAYVILQNNDVILLDAHVILLILWQSA